MRTPSPSGPDTAPHRRPVHRNRIIAVVVAVAVAFLLTGCDSTFRLTGGHPPCDSPLHLRINPTGFTRTQLTDIVTAAGVITAAADVSLQYDGATSQSWPTQDPRPGVAYVLIEHRSTTYQGREVAATASPWPDAAGVYRGGSIWFSPVSDHLPAGAPLDGTWGSTYLKLALHEWSHLMGLDDLDQTHRESMMSSATAPALSTGDLAGLITNGCYPPGDRTRLLAQLGV
jgi:hypothetical protein